MGAAVALAIGLAPTRATAQTAETKTAGQAFKNMTTALKDTPADQLMPAMQFISASLGVECSFCHVQGKMDADDKKAKKDARDMIAMTMAINKSHFDGKREVTCYSCHHGLSHPAGMPPVLEKDAPEGPGTRPPAPPSSGPTAEQLVEKYVTALGGADAINRVTSRVQKGTITAGGREMPIEIYGKAPNRRISIMRMQNGESITAFDGTVGWLGNTGRPPRDMSAAESDAARLDAELQLPTKIKEIFPQLRPGRPEKIGDVQCQTLNAMRPDQPPVRLYFDDASGLLVRMVRQMETPLGRIPTQIDYTDYKDVNGIKVPSKWTLSRPNGRFTIQVADIQQNVPVDDSKFAKPRE